jgi:hypothetical protein
MFLHALQAKNDEKTEKSHSCPTYFSITALTIGFVVKNDHLCCYLLEIGFHRA